MASTADALSAALSGAGSARLRTGTVAGSASSRITLTLAGATVPGVPYLSAYTPVIGDRVLVLQTDGGQMLVLGKPA